MVHASRLLKLFGLLAIAGIVIAILNPLPAKAATQNLSFVPTADAYVDESSPTSLYGSKTSLLVDGSPLKRSYIRFIVSGLNSDPVTNAVLMIYANSSLSAGFAVNALSNSTWTESNIDYSNAPTPGSVIAKSGGVSSGNWVSIDITSYVQGDGTYNLILTPLSTTNLNLASREAGAKAPQLVITYSTSGPTSTSTKTATPNASQTPKPTGTQYPGPTATQSTSATATATQPTSATATATQSSGTSGSGKVPVFSHIIVMIFENKEYSSIIGKSTLPNFNNLANNYALLTNSFAVGHPSLPNYLALTSGSTQGITSDCTTCWINAANIADSIEASGRTWKAYMESMPSSCFVGSSGLYLQKHNPFIYYNDIRQTGSRCKTDVVPLSQLDDDMNNNRLPNFAWITPNACNSAHSCSIATADKFVGAEVNRILSSPAFDQNSLLIVTFDEGSSSASCCGLPSSAGGHIATILISPLVKSGYQDATPYSHYSILATIEKSWGLPPMAHTGDSGSTPITAPWK